MRAIQARIHLVLSSWLQAIGTKESSAALSCGYCKVADAGLGIQYGLPPVHLLISADYGHTDRGVLDRLPRVPRIRSVPAPSLSLEADPNAHHCESSAYGDASA